MPSVLIVYDNVLSREGIKHLLRQEQRDIAFGEAANSEEVAARLGRRSWDVAVIEVSIPGADGFQNASENLRSASPATRVLMPSQHASVRYAFRARQLEANGYSAKNSSRAQILKALVDVLAGKEHFAESNKGRAGRRRVHPDLSSRERDILRACVEGKRVIEIATELRLSVKTVSTYKRRVLNKLQLNSVADLVRYAIDHQLS